jgi:hypothetical protein
VIYILYSCLCQLVDIRELLFVLLFVINRLFILFIVRLFVLFSSIPCLFIVQKRKSNSDPEPCSGISIPLPVQVPVVQHHHLESINITQQTPPTLS